MRNDAIIDALQILYDDAALHVTDAETSVMLRERVQLVLAYGVALIKRRKQRIDEVLIQREARENEIAIALALRSPVRFWWCESNTSPVTHLDESNGKLTSHLSYTVVLSGEHQTVQTLRGEISFGAQAIFADRSRSKKSELIPMVGLHDCD